MNHFTKVQEKLTDWGVDALLLTEAANRLYVSGFASAGTDGMALVTRRGCYYFTDSRYTEAAKRHITGATVEEISRERGYLTLVRQVLEQDEVQTLGFDDAYMTVADYRRYEEKLPVTLAGVSHRLEELRAVKDPEELTQIREAQRIAEEALEEILPELRPGRTEREIAARLQYLMLCRGAEKMSFDPIVVSGPNSSMPHGVPGDRKIEKGDFVTMDFGCIFHGYCSDMTRTVAIASATEEMRRIYDTVLAAQLAGIAAAKAGATGAQVDGAGREVIAAAGYGAFFGHGFGHSLGIEIHESPAASPANQNPLPCGAVITAEPGIYLPGKFGVRIEDMLLLTEDGCENLTKASKELLIL